MPDRTQEEEIVNAYTHLLCCIFSLTALGFFMFSSNTPVRFKISSLLMMGLSSWTFFSSYWYHSTSKRSKEQNREVDKTSIFLMITGCGTALNLGIIDPVTSSICSSILIFLGCLLTFLYVYQKTPSEIFSVTSYILLGWSCILPVTGVLGENVYNLSSSGWSVIAGGVAYSIGILYYARDSIKWNHTKWHICVMIGYAFHIHSHYKTIQFVSIS